MYTAEALEVGKEGKTERFEAWNQALSFPSTCYRISNSENL